MIRFSTPILDQKTANLSLINSTLIDMYIQPFEDWHLYEDGFNISLFNFTWKVISLEDDLMEIQLNFNHPNAISPKKK